MERLQLLAEEAEACCKKAWARASKAGTLPRDRWECPRCGQEFKPKQVGEITLWEAITWTARF